MANQGQISGSSENWRWRGRWIDGTLPTKTWTLARVEAALCHYQRRDAPEMVAELIKADWLAGLAGIPKSAVEAAFAEWLATSKWPPTIADIRGIATDGLRSPADQRRVEELERRLAIGGPRE